MPYIESESLRDKLNRERQLSVEETVELTNCVVRSANGDGGGEVKVAQGARGSHVAVAVFAWPIRRA